MLSFNSLTSPKRLRKQTQIWAYPLRPFGCLGENGRVFVKISPATPGLTTIQAGTYCYDCLPINLGAEESLDYMNYLNDLRTYPELKNFSDEQLLAMGIDCLALETANREKKYHSEDNQSDDLIWDEEAGLFYDYIQLPQPDGELIVPYWILNEELDQVGKAQISLFNNNLEIDSIFIEPYYQRRGIATSFVNHVVNYWDSELLRFSDAVSDEGVAFIDSFAAEDNYDSTYGVKQAKIRRRLKKKIKKQAIMGTKAGQWSARKSQELKRQYEAACQRAGLKPYKGQKTKKQQDLDMPDDVRNELILELGDVLWYVANLAYELNATLEEVAVGNIQKLESRKVRGVLSGSGDNR